MLERFSPEARQVVALAQDQARGMGHSQVGTEHLLLGLIAEETGAAGRAFAQLGVTLDAARDAIMALVRPGEPTPPDQPIPFSPRAKGTLEASLRQAMGFKDTFCARDGHRGRRPRRGVHRRAARPVDRRRLHPRRGGLRALERPDRGRARAAAKNAAALAAGATQAQGLNAAGAAAGHIFLEVWRYAEQQGARPESMIGLAGTGDLVGTALAPQSRNRQAGELLAAGVPAAEIPARIGQAVEALDLVPLLAHALERAQIEAPVTDALNRLISGELPLDDWVARVRATVPPPARFGSAVALARWRQRTKARLTRRRAVS